MFMNPNRAWSSLLTRHLSLFATIPILLVLVYYLTNMYLPYWRISSVFLLVGVFYALKKQFIQPNWPLIVLCGTGFLVYALNYHLLGKINPIPEEQYRYYKRIINQYVWFLPFLCLPTVFYNTGFKTPHFFNTLVAAALLLLFYVGFYNIAFEFDRQQLLEFFDPIIAYDIGAMAIGIVLLCHAFYVQKKWAYALVVLACLCIFTIMLHGSRGTWIGLPIVLALLCLQYFKTQLRKCGLTLALFALFMGGNLVIPNSPIMNRMGALQYDYQDISNQHMKSSSGIRLALWQNSFKLFLSQPTTGVGIYGIQEENCRLQAQGALPLCYQHQHSIVFHELASNGILGLLGLLLEFAIPLGYFWRYFKSPDALSKNLAVCGIATLVYFFCSGLTEYYLFFLDTTYWFYLLVASLMSLLYLHSQTPTASA